MVENGPISLIKNENVNEVWLNLFASYKRLALIRCYFIIATKNIMQNTKLIVPLLPVMAALRKVKEFKHLILSKLS